MVDRPEGVKTRVEHSESQILETVGQSFPNEAGVESLVEKAEDDHKGQGDIKEFVSNDHSSPPAADHIHLSNSQLNLKIGISLEIISFSVIFCSVSEYPFRTSNLSLGLNLSECFGLEPYG